MRQAKPRIGISGGSPPSASIKAALKLFADAGAEAVHLTDRDPRKVAEQLAGLSALVLMGNNYDIDPRDYGATNIHPESKVARDPASLSPGQEMPEAERIAFERARYEKALVHEAIRIKLPMMGVCGGMQRINVELGGTLHQHVPDMLDHKMHLQNADTTPFHVPVQFVRVDQGSLLAEIIEPTAIAMPAAGAREDLLIAENSIHHQAIDGLGNGLKANGTSIETLEKHDLIESFEVDPEGPLADLCLLGFQFHPEFQASGLGAEVAQFLLMNAVEYEKAKAQAQAFDARIVTDKYRQIIAARNADPRTQVAKSDITLATLHQLGTFRNIEELRQVPMDKIQAAMAQASQTAQAPPATAPPAKDSGRGR